MGKFPTNVAKEAASEIVKIGTEKLTSKLFGTQKGPGQQKPILKGCLAPIETKNKEVEDFKFTDPSTWSVEAVAGTALSKIPSGKSAAVKEWAEVGKKSILGVLAPPEERMYFQYNPTEFTDKKSVNYVSIQLGGKDSPVHQWYSGGDRILSFRILLDATAQGVEKPLEGFKGLKGILQTTSKIVKGATQIFKKGTGFKDKLKTGYNIYSDIKNFMKSPFYGILGEVTKYQDLLKTPEAREGMGPNHVIFYWGTEVALECMVQEVGVKYLLFNKDLIPIRGYIDIVLKEVSAEFGELEKEKEEPSIVSTLVRKGAKLLGF